MQAAARVLAVLSGVVLLSFVVTRVLPGDPVAMLAAQPGLTPEAVAAVRVAEGLDRPLPEQFARYVGALLQGDLGVSRMTGQPVAEDIARRFPASIELALAGFLPALGLALWLAARAARHPGGRVDRFARALAATGAALPIFVTGLLLIHLFYLRAGLVPEPSGRLSPWLAMPPRVTGLLVVDAALAGDWAAWRSAVAHLALPAITMAVFAVAPMLRVARAALIAAMAAPAVQAARLVGVPERRVLVAYAWPVAAGAVLPVAALTFGYMLGANVLAEKVFAWPGIGRYALDGVLALDHAPVQGVMLVLALVHAGVSLVADAVARRLDPRLRPHG